MGCGVSNWRLARAVSTCGQLGVVSGTTIDLIQIRRLQIGDPGGDVRRALAAFPDQRIAVWIVDRYFIEGGKPAAQPFATKPMVGEKHGRMLEELLIAANFVEVFLAKEGHEGMVGINYLNKILAPTLPSLFGAILAGVDVVLVGAGIPLEIPGVLDGLTRGEAVKLDLPVHGATQTHQLTFDPKQYFPDGMPELKRPKFFPIVASVTLATMLSRKSKIDGLVIEDSSAGGHNAPPRGALKLNDEGEPIYGSRDMVDPVKIAALGLPFWLAGGCSSPEKLSHARSVGASGIQLGTLFAFCEESGMRDDLKRSIIDECRYGTPEVFRDPVASPTGFPFQVLTMPGTLSEDEVYSDRCRQCDLGYLREAYEKPNGSIGWRCRSEDPEEYVKKGGKLEDTVGRKCLCNSLMANIGLGQQRGGYEEPPLVTCGEDLSGISAVLRPGADSFAAGEVIDYLLSESKMAEPAFA